MSKFMGLPDDAAGCMYGTCVSVEIRGNKYFPNVVDNLLVWWAVENNVPIMNEGETFIVDRGVNMGFRCIEKMQRVSRNNHIYFDSVSREFTAV